MGISQSRSQDFVDAEVAAGQAAQAAAKAETSATQASGAAQRAERIRSQLAEEIAVVSETSQSWWRSAESSIQRLRMQAQIDAEKTEADAKVAAANAQAQAAISRADAAEAMRHAWDAKRRDLERANAVLQDGLREAQVKINKQEFMWIAGLIWGLVGGALLGGLMGAAAAATGPALTGSQGARRSSDLSEFGIMSAVTDLTLQIVSLPNVLTSVGSLALTAVLVYVLVSFWTDDWRTKVRHISWRTALLSLGYGAVLVHAGDRSWSRGDDGSRILGGLLYCGGAVAAPVVAACMLHVAGWYWLTGVMRLGSRGMQSLVDMDRAGPAPAMMIVAGVGACAAMALYGRSGFPLLLVPATCCFYIGFVSLIMVLWHILRLSRCPSALLQPEVMATFAFGALMLLGFSASVEEQSRLAAARLAMLVSGMNAMLVALPTILMGVVDTCVPNGAGLALTSIYDPFTLGPKCFELLSRVRETMAFSAAAFVYVLAWVAVMNTALRLRLWTFRPFVLLSLNALCAASPYGSLGWTLVFRVPIGIWLLAVVMHVENSGSGMDPVLQEVLRWLGPHPGPFLQLLHGVLQASTAATAMICLGSGLVCARHQFGARSWIHLLICWGFSLLSLAARTDCTGTLVSLCFSTSATIFFFIGTHLLPDWNGVLSRLVVFLLAGRLCLLGHGSMVMTLSCGFAVCFLCLTMAFGENTVAYGMRQVLLHVDQARSVPVAFFVRLAASVTLFLHGVSTDGTVLVTLGCFCIYTSLASTIAGSDNLSRATIVALCALATMLLGEAAQTYMAPMQAGVAYVASWFPLAQILLDSSATDSLPFDVWILRGILWDVRNLIRGA
eukprot:TRINITY_DN29716_c0_g1_i1.p1 TRINITY_DN29716_c0_g1~~TRINITY_DN29716_c0_g1_i1.p1  ORF type:complete len:862 (+),score=145.11 TRINITY_DN29716_c0_g1_i1:65-2587(+)